MYQLLLKQRFKFAVRMVKRNIGAYLILIAIVPCILILQTIFYKGIMPSEKGFRFSSGL